MELRARPVSSNGCPSGSARACPPRALFRSRAPDVGEAAELANLAAGTTVRKIGTTGTPTHAEILAPFDASPPSREWAWGTG